MKHRQIASANISEYDSASKAEILERIKGNDKEGERVPSRADQLRYQHSQLIKTDDNMLEKLIDFSLTRPEALGRSGSNDLR